MPVTVTLEGFLELADQLALLRGQIHWSFYDNPAEQVAAGAAAHWLHALVAQAEDSSGLSLCGDLQRHLAVESRYIDSASKGGGRKANGHLAAQVLAIALKYRVLFDGNFDV